MAAQPTVNWPPLRTPSPILGRRKHRCFPLWQCPPDPTGLTWSVASPTVIAPGRTLGPVGRHRHSVLTVTTHTKPDGQRGQRGYFGSRAAPTDTR